MSDVYGLVRSLRAERWSRNRNFEAHASAEGVRARRLHRFLRALERDLRRASRVRISRETRGYRLELVFESLRLVRVVVLTDEEHVMLTEEPSLVGLLTPRGE